MTEQEVYTKIRPLLEGYTEGLYWDFKRSLYDTGEIIRDILAFSNSSHEEDSYLIIGVGEPSSPNESTKIQLSTDDRRRLNTDANFLYLPGTWDVSGLSANDIESMKQFSAKLTQTLACSMLICFPLVRSILSSVRFHPRRLLVGVVDLEQVTDCKVIIRFSLLHRSHPTSEITIQYLFSPVIKLLNRNTEHIPIANLNRRH